ncbi:glycoside hydrolase family 3 N-terminal domain-containing protein [Paenibacillus sp. 276b]|uniref:glycoside hydrolase family 3 N-terminal domain-containing protein n=1 Tax=Paenibacillus sp. 276b TaxID=1566277 RepID=UPI00089C44F0|nr:glycoside hydrolase family 3 N-terminal domain-containing protein [Paenibacillus sp. 276b]SEA61193.1 beta-glucosidase [Paenibacillus sp. 276b]
MIGTWHFLHQTPDTTIKMQFIIENKEDIALSVILEPFPFPVEIHTVTVEGNMLQARGMSQFVPGESFEFDLTFEDQGFQGRIKLPHQEDFFVSGSKGTGPSLEDLLISTLAPYRKKDVRQRDDHEIRQAVEALLKKMSITDKIGQMSQCMSTNLSLGSDVESDTPEKLIREGRVGSVLSAVNSNRVFELQKIAVEQSPHGIPLLFNFDVIHGFQTVFPVPLAWSCSWDMEAIQEANAIAAKEASATGINYNHGPMVDITRDPRWGRVVEGAGEDPYLGSLIAKAQVEGFQGDSLFDPETIIACLKHFIAYGAAEAGRDYNTVDISEGTLRNMYLPPFQAGVEAGAGSVMNSFNTYQGVPVAASRYILNDLLRRELGFDGILISDYGSIDEIVAHGNAKDSKEAAQKALDATMDIEMVTRSYDHLHELIEQGLVAVDQLNEAVRRILTYKYKIGIMDDPFRYVRPEKEKEYHFHPNHLEASLTLAKKSIVLLKNNNVLPLANKEQKLALIGPFGDSKDMLGPWQWSRYSKETITLREGLEKNGILKTHLMVEAGCKVEEALEEGIEQAVRAAEQADIVILALGESSELSGEAASRMDITLPKVQQELAEAVVRVGKPTILVLTNGRPLVLDWFERHVDAIVETWFLGSQAGHAIADVLLGKYNPSGKLTMSFPVHIGQVPVYYNHFKTGRPVTESNKGEKFFSRYIDGSNDPLYPFGYGLSYTTFEISDIRLSKTQMTDSETIFASVTVTNTGAVSGEETVQMYIQDLYGSVVRPVKELKGFKKVKLATGEAREICFSISKAELVYWNPNQTYGTEPGDFKVYIGTSSIDVKEASFELVQQAQTKTDQMVR